MILAGAVAAVVVWYVWSVERDLRRLRARNALKEEGR